MTQGHEVRQPRRALVQEDREGVSIRNPTTELAPRQPAASSPSVFPTLRRRGM